MRWRAIPVLVIGLLMVGAASSQPAAASDVLEGVNAFGPVEFAGLSQLSTEQGAALLQPEKLSSIRLQAEKVTIEHRWERGVDMRPNQSLTRVASERDEETIVIDQVNVEFERFHEKEATTLIYSEDDAKRISFHTLEGWSLVLEDGKTMNVGIHDDSMNSGGAEVPKFSHTTKGPLLAADGTGTVRADGDFSLFVHDLVIDAKGDGRQWSDWTGYWVNDPEAPSSEYEFRVTTIHVENGTFLTSSEKSVELFTPSLSGDIEGDVTASSVTGRLLREESVHVFDDDHLHLKGSGTIAIDVFEAEETPRTGVVLTPRGDFTIRGSSLVETTVDDTLPAGLWMFLSLGGLLLVSATTAGLARRGFLPAPTEATKGRWHTLWMGRGQKASNEGRFDRACRYYRIATRVDRDEPLGWYEWAHAELLEHHYDNVDRVAELCKRVPGVDRHDLMDLQASAAWYRGDRAAFNSILEEIATVEPGIARGLVREHGVQRKFLNTNLRKLIEPSEPEGGVLGYS